MWEKPRQSTDYKIHYGRGVQQQGYTEATTSCPLLLHTRRLQLRQRPLSLSLTLYNFYLQKCSTTTMFFALSHIYTYMTFGLFTHVSLPIGRMDRSRVFGHPVLPNFHPEGPISQHYFRVYYIASNGATLPDPSLRIIILSNYIYIHLWLIPFSLSLWTLSGQHSSVPSFLLLSAINVSCRPTSSSTPTGPFRLRVQHPTILLSGL